MINIFFTNTAYAESIDAFIIKVNTLIINPLIYLMFALALVFFVWGVFQFIANGENEEQKTTGKKHMLWGVIGLTVMFGVWSLLHVVLNTFNLGDGIVPEKGQVKLGNYDPNVKGVGEIKSSQ